MGINRIYLSRPHGKRMSVVQRSLSEDALPCYSCRLEGEADGFLPLFSMELFPEEFWVDKKLGWEKKRIENHRREREEINLFCWRPFSNPFVQDTSPGSGSGSVRPSVRPSVELTIFLFVCLFMMEMLRISRLGAGPGVAGLWSRLFMGLNQEASLGSLLGWEIAQW